MKKCLSILLLWGCSLSAQVGINTLTPNSTLAINGSLRAAYKEITANTYSILDTDHYMTYNGTGAATFTLPVIGTGTKSYTGRIYKIKNISTSGVKIQASGDNTLRLDNVPITSFVIPRGAYAEVVNNSNTSNGTWDMSFVVLPRPNNVEIYGTQLSIPPHAGGTNGTSDWIDHANASYDDVGNGDDVWWIISKKSIASVYDPNYNTASKMTLVYEYQGPPFNITNMHPTLTAGNNSSNPDVFTASFVSLRNNGTGGKTRLTVTVARVDQVGANGGNRSNWNGTFLLNILLARKL